MIDINVYVKTCTVSEGNNADFIKEQTKIIQTQTKVETQNG